jgi:hypothetical protein
MWDRMKSGIAFADELFKAPKRGCLIAPPYAGG